MEDQENMLEGIVYILVNETMHNLIKIGFTTRSGVEARMEELSRSTSVPVPFDCVYAARVSDCRAVEKALHIAFEPDRINPKREFFYTEPDRAIGIIKLLEIEDVTPEVVEELEENLDVADKEAKINFQKRKPLLNYIEMGIPVGSILTAKGGEFTCEVISGRKVKYNDEEMSLTKASKLTSGNTNLTNPCLYWYFNERLLNDIYNETY